jgi:Flp pilus assembly protein TadD
MPGRVLLAGGAVAAAVWLGFGLSSALLQRSAQRTGFRAPETLSPSQIAHATHQFERARKHNPDTQPAVNEAALLARVGQQDRAVSILRGVVDKEPDNLTAWVILSSAAARREPTLAARAADRARELNPPVAPVR